MSVQQQLLQALTLHRQGELDKVTLITRCGAQTIRSCRIYGSRPPTSCYGRSLLCGSLIRNRSLPLRRCGIISTRGKRSIRQVHLGYDLAVTEHVGVEASNDGRVVYAAPLGIQSNCIVVDHGYGLQTLYGHLIHIDVHEGDMVKRGQVMGTSGQMGMAGGSSKEMAIWISPPLQGCWTLPKSRELLRSD